MVVARNCRRRRSPAVRSSSPTSLMLPPDGTSEPFCNSPMTLSDVTDFPDPLSPTRHKVSPSRTCSETPSMIRSLRGFLPRPTTRLSMSRTTLVISSLVVKLSLAALTLFHAGIERVARGVADQVDAEDCDRQQQPRPEDQRRFYL